MITVLLPSRGRPEGAKRTIDSFNETKSRFDTNLMLVLNETDPKYLEYMDYSLSYFNLTREHDTLTKKLNFASSHLDKTQDFDIIGFVADDNIFRTNGWDERISQVLTKPGIAYGNDLYQGENIPTSWFVSVGIIRALGWFALPSQYHMYLDNAWKILGERLGRIHYLPDVIIEHMHPAAGKGTWDGTYIANDDPKFGQDKDAFNHWVETQLDEDVRRVNEAVK